ncbi:reverse transcriptase domain-containing protein [Tanacetum coccineum]
MADTRTMAELLQAPTGGFENAIVIPPFQAENFELKPSLITLVQSKVFRDKEPPQSILTWEDLVAKFINHFFPPSKTTNLRNEITGFRQYANETFYEAWDRFKEFLQKCPHHGFPLTHQIDTFYNALNFTDQDSLNSAAGGRNHIQQVKILLAINLKEIRSLVVPTPATVKAVEEKCITCGDRHHYSNCPLTRSGNDFPIFHDNIHQFQQTAAVGNFVQRNSENRFPSVANQMRPPGFTQPNANRNNQGIVPYQAPTPQSQVVTSNELEKFKKTNDANLQAMRNHITNLKTELRSEMQTTMQNQNNILKNELTSEIKNMLGQFFVKGQQSCSLNYSVQSYHANTLKYCVETVVMVALLSHASWQGNSHETNILILQKSNAFSQTY